MTDPFAVDTLRAGGPDPVDHTPPAPTPPGPVGDVVDPDPGREPAEVDVLVDALTETGPDPAVDPDMGLRGVTEPNGDPDPTDNGPFGDPLPSRSALHRWHKDDLIALAADRGLATDGTKDDILDRFDTLR